MRSWGKPEEFMASSDVKTLVSYVEARGYYTEAEKRALVAMAECGMPPWEAAKRLSRWMWSKFDSSQIHESVTTAVRVWRSNHQQQEPTPGGWTGHRGQSRGYRFDFGGPGTGYFTPTGRSTEDIRQAWEKMMREAEESRRNGFR